MTEFSSLMTRELSIPKSLRGANATKCRSRQFLFKFVHSTPIMNVNKNLLFARLFLIGFSCIFVAIVSVYSLTYFPAFPLWLLLVECLLFSAFSFFVFNKNLFSTSISVSIQLLHDLFALTLFLALTGGSNNPLNIFYLIPISCAAILLSFQQAFGFFLVSLSCYLLLSFLSFSTQFNALMHLDSLQIHFFGMGFAYLMSSLLILFFVSKLVTLLRQKDQELHLLYSEQKLDSYFQKMGRSAMHHAHELNTPLSILEMIFEEFSMTSSSPLIKKGQAQLLKCKHSVSRVLTASGIDAIQSNASKPLSDLLSQLQDRVSTYFPHLILSVQSPSETLLVSSFYLEEILEHLISNSAAVATSVRISVSLEPESIVLSLYDNGPGLNPDLIQSLSQPLSLQIDLYLSNAESTRGMGLVLSQLLAKRAGALLLFFSDPLSDLRVQLKLPRAPLAPL